MIQYSRNKYPAIRTDSHTIAVPEKTSVDTNIQYLKYLGLEVPENISKGYVVEGKFHSEIKINTKTFVWG